MTTIYEYAVLSKTGVMVKGQLSLPNGTSIYQATIKAVHEGARAAFKSQRDPFNVKVALRIESPNH